jgi:raffinose/stachyose/melibiose transport system permease protein
MDELSVRARVRVPSRVRAKKKIVPWAELRKKWHLYLFILPTFAFLIVFRYYPAGSAIYHAFTKWNGAGISEWVGLANFERMLRDTILIASVKNIAILVIASVIKVLIFPLAAAELIYNLSNPRARYLFRLVLIIPMVAPGIVNNLVWRFIMGPRPFGVLNAFLELIGLEHWVRPWLADPKIALYSLIFVGFPWVGAVAMLIYYAGLQNIPDSLIDASLIDGASTLRRIWSIDLPLLMGQVKLQMVMTTIFTIQGFSSQLVLTNGGPGYATMVPGLWMYQRAFQGDAFGYASAIGFMMFVVMMVITYVNNRYIKSSTEYEA